MEYNISQAMEWSRLSSRKVFGRVMDELVASHPECMVIVADVASSAGLESFAKNHPSQFVNAGIAENNMLAVATGMAESGKNVFVTTFAPFASMRCFEVVRTYVGYMHANVKIVGLASGLSMGVGGNTHFGLEDVALMRTIPGMTVVCPADCTETVKAVEAALQFQGPMYLRLTGVNGNPIVYKEDYDLAIGKGIVLKEGNSVAVLANGLMVNESLRVAKLLSRSGVDATVVDLHTVKPLDEELLLRLAATHHTWITVEEHSIIGGLGTAITEFVRDHQLPVKLKALGLPDQFGPSGSYAFLMGHYGLNAKAIAEEITKFIQENNQ